MEGISFCNIAEKAHATGRDELAIKVKILVQILNYNLISPINFTVIRVGA